TGVEGGGDVCAGYSEQKTVGRVLIAHPGDGSPEAIAEMGVRTQVELGSRQAENAAITAEVGVGLAGVLRGADVLAGYADDYLTLLTFPVWKVELPAAHAGAEMVAGLGSAGHGHAVVLTLTEMGKRGDFGGADTQPVHDAGVADGTHVLVGHTHPGDTKESVDGC